MDSSTYMRARIARTLFYNHTARSALIAGGCGSPVQPPPPAGTGFIADLAVGARYTTATQYDDILDFNQCPVVGADYSGPFTPNEIPALSLWLDADASEINYVETASGQVGRWRDRSGLANDMVIPTGITAKPVVGDVTVGDATYRHVAFNNNVLKSTNIINSPDFSVFCVGTYMSDAGLGDHYIMASYNKVRVSANSIIYNSPSFLRTTHSYNSGVRKLFSIVARTNTDGTTLTAGVDGVVSTVSTVTEDTGAAADAGFTLGARSADGGSTFGNYANVLVNEVVAYKNNLSQTERQKVEGYLAAKWGLTLPADHPWAAAAP